MYKNTFLPSYIRKKEEREREEKMENIKDHLAKPERFAGQHYIRMRVLILFLGF